MFKKKTARLIDLELVHKIVSDVEKLFTSYGLGRTEIRFVVQQMWEGVNAIDDYVSKQSLGKIIGLFEPKPHYTG